MNVALTQPDPLAVWRQRTRNAHADSLREIAEVLQSGFALPDELPMVAERLRTIAAEVDYLQQAIDDYGEAAARDDLRWQHDWVRTYGPPNLAVRVLVNKPHTWKEPKS